MNEKPCPKCGHCPTCGRGPTQVWPQYYYPYPPQWWQQPVISYGTSSGLVTNATIVTSAN